MQAVILGLLLTGPLSLYDIRKHFSAGIALFYSASFGSIQRALDTLVAEGAVEVSAADDSRRHRKLHTVTDQGRLQWRNWMLEPIPEGTSAETVVLAKVFLLGRLEAATDRAAVLDTIRESLAATVGSLLALGSELDSAAPDLAPGHRTVHDYQRATLDYGIRAHDLMINWIDELRASR